MSVACIILTMNEERNIAACIESTSGFFEKILVVDSGSNDDTVKIAENYGALVVHHPFEGFGPQYNFALSLAATEWIFILDADERLNERLIREIRAVTCSPDSCAAYQVARRNFFMGKWVRHCGGFWPDYQTKLWKRGLARHEDRAVHSLVIVDGETKKLESPLEHLTYDSVSQYIEKLNRYTTLEQQVRSQTWNEVSQYWHQYTFRMRAKFVLRNAPLRPLLRFLYMYVYKAGFLDGKVGLVLCALSSFAEFVGGVKHYELKRSEGQH